MVLALLFSLLFGFAPAAAAAAGDVDRGAVRLGKPDAGKANISLRSGGRLENDEQEGDELVAAPPAGIVTFTLSSYPEAAAFAGDCHEKGAPVARAYQARAPPAA
jgi:hypothetical protein